MIAADVDRRVVPSLKAAFEEFRRWSGRKGQIFATVINFFVLRAALFGTFFTWPIMVCILFCFLCLTMSIGLVLNGFKWTSAMRFMCASLLFFPSLFMLSLLMTLFMIATTAYGVYNNFIDMCRDFLSVPGNFVHAVFLSPTSSTTAMTRLRRHPMFSPVVLRDARGEIPVLFRHCAVRRAQKGGFSVTQMSPPDFVTYCESYDFACPARASFVSTFLHDEVLRVSSLLLDPG